jgi:hypothetical protein
MKVLYLSTIFYEMIGQLWSKKDLETENKGMPLLEPLHFNCTLSRVKKGLLKDCFFKENVTRKLSPGEQCRCWKN